MTGVNEDQKKAMAAIMAAMNSGMGEATPQSSNSGSSAPSGLKEGSDAAKKAAMGDIMKMFREATENVRETAQDDGALMEAFCTTKTETGVRISEWEIVISENDGRSGKFYSIIRDDIQIASDLRLYEAALLLTQTLNRGESITSAKVREILRLEEEFAKNLEDAARYARMIKSSTGQKQQIAEARFSDAKAKAILAKEQIKAIRV
jgi:ABC-type oligopeptide transport system ATPase subunit